MSTLIKSELFDETQESCLGCLSKACTIIQEISPEILQVYSNLLNQNLSILDAKLIRFCDCCMKFLQKAVKFREKCLESFESLIKTPLGNDDFEEYKVFIPEPENTFLAKTIIDDVFSEPIKVQESEEMSVELEDEKQVYQCEMCFEIFVDKKLYASHVKHEIKRQILHCDICEYSTKGKANLVNHMYRKHLPKPMKSKNQSKTDKEVTCIDCGKVCASMSKYKSHQRIYHSVKTHTCNQCGISYTYGSDLQRHIERKHETHYKDCPICGKQYKAISLTGHIAAVHLQRRNFACDQCDQKFKSSSQLKKHKYSHGKLRPFMCQECGTGYYMNELLRKHYERQHQIIYSQEEIRKLCGKGAGIGGAPLKYARNNVAT